MEFACMQVILDGWMTEVDDGRLLWHNRNKVRAGVPDYEDSESQANVVTSNYFMERT